MCDVVELSLQSQCLTKSGNFGCVLFGHNITHADKIHAVVHLSAVVDDNCADITPT